jgi:uncharacterized protein (DUF1330 family)
VLVDGGRKVPYDGDFPPSYVVLTVFDSMDKALKWRESAAFQRAKTVRDKSAKIRSYAVEGLAD